MSRLRVSLLSHRISTEWPVRLSRRIAATGARGFAWRWMVAGVVLCGVLLRPEAVSAQGSSTVYLPLSLSNAVAGMEPVPGSGTTSEILINEAEDAGAITHEQALTYKVLALFGDSRLPEQFRSSAMAEDSQVMAHVRAEWATLSARAQADLAPFLLPPNEQGSWHELATVGAQAGVQAQAIEWRTVEAPGAGVKVWYQTWHQGDDVKAAGVAAAIDAIIKPRLDEVMGREWMADGELPKNGGDDRLDIYLVRSVNYRGLATPYTGCESTPAWINVNSDRILGDATHAGIVQTTAHEMLHAVQYAYPLQEACSTYDWLAEASAKWFEHATYPGAQSEHPYAPPYLRTAYWPLENTADERHYGAYLYPLTVTQRRGSVTAVRRMWEYSGTMDSLEAVNEAAPFDTFWDDFVLCNWNQGPHTEYQTWDSFTHTIKPHSPTQALAGQPEVSRFLMPVTLEHLSAQYFHFRFTDPNVRSVMFYNGLTHNLVEESAFPTENKRLGGDIVPAEQREGITVQAMYKIEGEADWHVEDWTLSESEGFCRDARAQRLEELVLVFANAQWDETEPSYTFGAQGEAPQLVYSDVGCWQWKGTVTATRPDDDTYDSFQISVTDLVLERAFDWMSESTIYEVKSGSGTINYIWRDDAIEQWGYTDGPQPFTLTPDNTGGQLVTHNLYVAGPNVRAYRIEGSLSTSAEHSYHWYYDDDPEAGGPYDHPGTEAVGQFWSLPGWAGDEEIKALADGDTMQGSYFDGYQRYDYNLTAQRE